ncbi:NmrA family NAD(P)-binding protein [Mesorhizobium sp. BH1-1-5]|uniref:NmrA family NAD(P)-binding protein n=1 Tax=Mesorhizobium sp. BH1-1-5 TaxID=2876661 RepID=UPI001CCF35D0|nr:NmrA family NAD(P)-binding protein [Mesorhizobium sp. BH1-1-5]MBZ9988899.1 NmrA family NAD(P)-binding protein [Mesorhizobium sp. BH1-1-5]
MGTGETVLVTGATGRTGKAVIAALAARGARIRAMTRTLAAQDGLRAAGAHEIAVADLGDRSSLDSAVSGIGRLYHIGPRFNDREIALGANIIAAASDAGLRHFVLHSVFHSQCRTMIHHRQKLRLEEMLIESGLPYTILQPAMYMQNIALEWSKIEAEGIYERPYRTDLPMAMVDLADLAEAAAVVLTTERYIGGTYELVGGEPLSHADMAKVLTGLLGKPVQASRYAPTEWRRRNRDRFPDDYLRIYAAMCRHYDRFGLPGGNPVVASMILGREPTGFGDFARRFAAERKTR